MTVPSAWEYFGFASCSVAFEAFLLLSRFCFLKLPWKVHWNLSSKVLKTSPQYWKRKLTHSNQLDWELCFFAFWKKHQTSVFVISLKNICSYPSLMTKISQAYMGCSLNSLDLVLHLIVHSWSISDLFQIFFLLFAQEIVYLKNFLCW